MDRKIKKKKWTPKRISLISGSVLIMAFLIYLPLEYGSASRLNVNKDQLTIATVKRGTFQEYIPVDGTVTPVKTVYLDAIEGGVIKRVLHESGDMIKQGDTVLVISNSSMQLQTMYQESNLYNQINNVRNTRISIQQTSLNLRNAMVDARYALETAKAQYKRDSALFSKGAITLSNKDFEDDKANYKRTLEKWKIARSAFRQDSLLHQTRVAQLNRSENRLNKSLDYVEKILNNLIVTAPIKGQLTTPDLQIGQSINQGQRLGQVDEMNNYKVKADIDEHYITRVDTGLTATVDYNNQAYRLKVNKVYPTVTNGQFEVDMEFINKLPDDLKRGQALQIRLQLGHSEQALLLPRGGFYQSTGGNWVYLVNKKGTEAQKHNIQLGRQNPDYFEVLNGLKPGDKVVVSSYDSFGKNDVLQF